MCNKENNECCCALTIIGSLLLAAGVAAVFYSGIVTSILTLIIITLIFGILSLLTLIFLLYCNREEACFCINKTCLVTTLIGSIISSSFALAITSLSAFSIPVAILIGVVTFFLITNLVNLAKAIICIICIKRCR